jgi:hypothetical protein
MKKSFTPRKRCTLIQPAVFINPPTDSGKLIKDMEAAHKATAKSTLRFGPPGDPKKTCGNCRLFRVVFKTTYTGLIGEVRTNVSGSCGWIPPKGSKIPKSFRPAIMGAWEMGCPCWRKRK